MKRTLRTRFRLLSVAAGIGALLTFQLLAAYPQLAEAAYARGPGHHIPSVLSRVTAWVPFTLAEVFVAGFVLRQLIGLARGWSAIRNRRRKWRETLMAGVLRLGSDAGILIVLFYVFWGFHYARQPLEERSQWSGTKIERSEIELLAHEMIDAANAEYRALHESDDTGEPTRRSMATAELMDLLESGWRDVESLVDQPRLANKFGRPKPLLASRVLDHLGIAGVYFPWTGEANYNSGTPDSSLPHVVAHEMSHQRGFAREDEANFIGFLVAAGSPHAYCRYSAFVFAQQQLLVALAGHDRDEALEMIRLRLPGVQRDVDAARAYWAQFEGPASRATRTVNDAYLKSQRVPGGIRNYSRSVVLLIAYARSRGDSLVR